MSASTITAMVVTILFCRDGTLIQSTLCANGLPKTEATMSVMTGEYEPKDCPQPFLNEAWRTCPINWTALVKIEVDNRPLMILHPDGRLEAFEGFKPDEGARLFWEALSEVLKLQVGK